LQSKLQAEGHAIAFVGAHGRSADYLEHQAEIAAKIRFPLLQERDDADLRGLLGAQTRHDVFLFDGAGALVEHLVNVDDVSGAAGAAAFEAKVRAALLGGG
jgi:hypothetical protein